MPLPQLCDDLPPILYRSAERGHSVRDLHGSELEELGSEPQSGMVDYTKNSLLESRLYRQMKGRLDVDTDGIRGNFSS